MDFSYLRLAREIGLKRTLRAARHECKRIFLDRHPWYNPAAVCGDPAVIVGGCGRSGTTLIREMLDRHPDIAIGPETAILCDFPNPSRLAFDFGLPEAEIRAMIASSPHVIAFAGRFFRDYARTRSKPVWGDKTPRNVRAVPRILRWLPRARFIHMIRDGRDVACSLRNHPRETVRNGRLVPNVVNRSIADGARRWIEDTSAGLALRGHPRVIEVRYEQLTAEPERELRRICDFLAIDFHPAMAEGKDEGAPADLTDGRLMNNRDAASKVHRKSLSRWRRDMKPDERADFVRVAGELLIALGYAPDHSWVNEDSTNLEAKPTLEPAMSH